MESMNTNIYMLMNITAIKQQFMNTIIRELI